MKKRWAEYGRRRSRHEVVQLVAALERWRATAAAQPKPQG
jgi:hypothetical protein